MIAQPKGASKVYDTPAGRFTALNATTIDIRAAEWLLIIGQCTAQKVY